MELPLFALHSVLFPGGDLELQVFEERYLRMMEDVLPKAPFAIAAIRHGREVGGPYDPYRVGVRVVPVDFELGDDGTYLVHVRAEERIRLREPSADGPYPRWRVEPFPELGLVDPDVSDAAITTAVTAAVRFLGVAGVKGDLEVGHDPVAMSYMLCALTPGLVPDRQAFLEIPGTAERLAGLTRRFRQEAALLRALRARRGS
ncbi:MAG TPA: LON peptidase substrate-binding domain-containing protein [Actinomycetota bacterium]|nr:LON peptidase substrate-binding domain-containing protein [Actinomycetota bacterium]